MERLVSLRLISFGNCDGTLGNSLVLVYLAAPLIQKSIAPSRMFDHLNYFITALSLQIAALLSPC
jgi:hypothetical protein